MFFREPSPLLFRFSQLDVQVGSTVGQVVATRQGTVLVVRSVEKNRLAGEIKGIYKANHPILSEVLNLLRA